MSTDNPTADGPRWPPQTDGGDRHTDRCVQETHESGLDDLVTGWFQQGDYIGRLVNELQSRHLDDSAREALDFELEAMLDVIDPAPSRIWAADIDDYDPTLRVPHRPIPRGPLILGATIALGWLAYAALVLPDIGFTVNDAMAGVGPGSDLNHLPDVLATHEGARGTIISEMANFSGDARPLPPPAPGSWLHTYPERGQSYLQFISRARRATPERSIIYVIPLGELGQAERQVLETTREYLSLYYSAPTELLAPTELPPAAFDAQRGQYHARELIAALAPELPGNAMGMVAVTGEDLYLPSTRFVFGMGSREHRVAVFSLARYGSDFTHTGEHGTVLRRSSTVAVHEFGHVLGMRHCTEYQCLMNGTNSLEEADRHTLSLCPVCARKAEFAIGFDRVERYERLNAFYTYYGFEVESVFTARRLTPPMGR